MQKEIGKVKIDNYNEIKYIIYTPENIEKNMPLLLFLHGIGERGTNINDIERYSLPRYMNEFNIPYIVVAPQCSPNNFWDYHLREIEQILIDIYKKLNYDKKRVFVLGSSMGAYGAWNYLIQRPNLFKGIISSSGGIMLPIEQNLNLIKKKAMLIYHGDADDVINVKESINTYEMLKKNGAKNVELKIIKNANHFSSSYAFKEAYLYEWLSKNI